jgi:hypothetical protein
MKQINNEEIWLKNPLILFKQKYLTNFIINHNMSRNSKYNAITRLILILTFLGFLLTKSFKILLISIFSLTFLSIFYIFFKSKSNIEGFIDETNLFPLDKNIHPDQSNVINSTSKYINSSNFTLPTKENPMMNPTLVDLNTKPNKLPAAPSFNPIVENKINDSVKNNLNDNLFRDLGDNIEFNYSMQNFYTNPNTQTPNDQKAFADFCYGGMLSCKEGNEFQCMKKNYRHILA